MATPETNGDGVSLPAIQRSGSGNMGDGGAGAGGGLPPPGYGGSLNASASQQLLLMREALSRRPSPPVVNGMTPYLDVMTISSAQFPTAIDGGKNQEEHTRLLMEPISVPNLDHTGLTMHKAVKEVPLFYPTGKKNCNFRDTIRGRVRTVARTGILTPDVAQQDALADSIRDAVKERLATRQGRGRQGVRTASPPGAAARTRELTRMMRGEHAMTPGFSRDLARSTRQSSRRRGRRRKGHGSSSRPRSVMSTGSLRSRGSRGSRRRGQRSPGSVASGRSAFSGTSRSSVYSGLSRARAIDSEARALLKSLSKTNEAMTRALTRA